jgi:hypothetical protein
MTLDLGFGQTPLAAALDAAMAPAVARLEELAISGFETESLFDPTWLSQAAAAGTAFVVTSTTTHTAYTLVLRPGTQTDTAMHAVLVRIGENWLNETNMRKLTVVKSGADSRMLIYPGWRNGV